MGDRTKQVTLQQSQDWAASVVLTTVTAGIAGGAIWNLLYPEAHAFTLNVGGWAIDFLNYGTAYGAGLGFLFGIGMAATGSCLGWNSNGFGLFTC